MPAFVALLRAVNVGGTGKLPMTELKSMCEGAGFTEVQTYIASGNVVFNSSASAAQVKSLLEKALHAYAGKAVAVMVRSATEMAQVLADNPFPDGAPNRVVAIFLEHPPAPDTIDKITGRVDEQVALGQREVYVHYGDGMADAKLKLPSAMVGTARNMNTVAKLAALAAQR
jgi:uncharacterized protein (DUF1697 family)